MTFLRPPRGVAFRAEHWTGSTSRRQKKRCFDIVDQEGAGTGVSARGDPRFKYRKRDVHSFAVQLQNHGPIFSPEIMTEGGGTWKNICRSGVLITLIIEPADLDQKRIHGFFPFCGQPAPLNQASMSAIR